MLLENTCILTIKMKDTNESKMGVFEGLKGFRVSLEAFPLFFPLPNLDSRLFSKEKPWSPYFLSFTTTDEFKLGLGKFEPILPGFAEFEA